MKLYNFFLLLVILNIPFYVFSQQYQKIFLDSDKNLVTKGENAKYYRIIDPVKDANSNVKVKEYYLNGSLAWEGTFINGNSKMKQDTAKSYYHNGNLKSITVYDHNMQNGIEIWYYANGTMSSSINYLKGICDGRFYQYYPNGQISKKGFYKNYEFDSICEEYYPNGKMKLQANYHMGEIQGKETKYYPNGQIASICHYKNGIKDGENEYYYFNGQIADKLFVQNGLKEGEEFGYYENGKLSKHYNWHLDLMDGNQVEYYPNGRMRAQGLNIKNDLYFYDPFEGTGLTYYTNGNLNTKSYSDTSGAHIFEKYDESGGKLILRKIEPAGLDNTNGRTNTTVDIYGNFDIYGNLNLSELNHTTTEANIKVYNDDGTLFKRLYYFQNLRTDSTFYPNGKLKAIVNFNDDEIVKEFIQFDTTGRIIDKFEAIHLAKDVSTCLFGYKNESGDWIIKPKYTLIDEFSEGYAKAMIKEKNFLIDNKGKDAVDTNYLDIELIGSNDPAKNDDKIFESKVNLNIRYARMYFNPKQFIDFVNLYAVKKITGYHVFFKVMLDDGLYHYANENGIINKFSNFHDVFVSDTTAYIFTVIDSLNSEFGRNGGTKYKYGLIDVNGRILIPPEYCELQKGSNKILLTVKCLSGGCYANFCMGLSNIDGKELLPCNYNSITHLWDNYWIVEKNNEYFIFDDTQIKFIQGKFDKFQSWPGYRCVLVENNGKKGLLNKSMQLVLPCNYEYIEMAKDGYAIAITEKKSVVFSISEKKFLPFKYDKIIPFHCETNSYVTVYGYKDKGKWGMLDTNFQTLVPAIYDTLFYSSRYGVCKYSFIKGDSLHTYGFSKYDDEYYPNYANGESNKIYHFSKLPPSDASYSFDELIKEICYNKCGLIDYNGKIIVPFDYAISKDEFSDYLLYNNKTAECISVDESGKINWKSNSFSEIIKVEHYPSAFATYTGKIAIPDKNGNLLFDTLFEVVSNIDRASNRMWVKDVIAEADYIKSDELDPLEVGWALADIQGHLLSGFIYNTPTYFINNYAVVDSNQHTGVIDINGKTLIPCKYTSIVPQNDGNFVLYTYKVGFGLADSGFNIKYEAGSFDDLSPSLNGYYIFFKDSLSGLINPELKIQIQAGYLSFPKYPTNLFDSIFDKDIYRFSKIIEEKNNAIIKLKQTKYYQDSLKYLISKYSWDSTLLTYSNPNEGIEEMINDIADYEKPNNSKFVKNETFRRLLMNYLVNCFGKTYFKIKGSPSAFDQTFKGLYLSSKKQYLYDNMDEIPGITENYSYAIGDILPHYFSICENHFEGCFSCPDNFGEINNFISKTHIFQFSNNNLIPIKLDDLFNKGSDYKKNLNALLISKLQESDEMTFKCDEASTLFDQVKDNFVIHKDNITFYYSNENSAPYVEDSRGIPLKIPWSQIKSMLTSKFLKDIKLEITN